MLLPPPPPPTSQLKKPQPAPLAPFKKGHLPATALVRDASEITDAFLVYYEEQITAGEPVDLYTWFAYATRHIGIGRRWWGRVMRGDKEAPKIEGLRQACEAVENVIAGHLSAEALKNKLHPGLVAQQIKTMEERDQLAAEKEAAAKAAENQIPPELVANIIHPDCTHEQLVAIERQGLKPLLYTQAQLEAGMPHLMPAGFQEGANEA